MSGPPRHHRERCCSSPASPAARSLDRRFSPSPPTRTPQPTAETTPHTRADHRPRSFAAPGYPSSPRSTALREGQAVCRSHSPLAHSVGSGRTESPLALPRTRVQLHEAGRGLHPQTLGDAQGAASGERAIGSTRHSVPLFLILYRGNTRRDCNCFHPTGSPDSDRRRPRPTPLCQHH